MLGLFVFINAVFFTHVFFVFKSLKDVYEHNLKILIIYNYILLNASEHVYKDLIGV